MIAAFSLLVCGCVGLRTDNVEDRVAARDTAALEGEGNDSGRAQPGQAQISPAVLQQTVMDFSDQYVSGLWPAFDAYMRQETDLTRRVNAQKWKVMLSASAMTIAGSRDPRAGLLDMAVFISAGKWALDKFWMPEVFGDKIAPLRDFYAEMDRKIWSDVAQVLTPEQQSDLRALIVAWEESNPSRQELLDVRLRNLDGVVLSKFAQTSSAKGLRASIQKLWGKVDESLLYGERMIFFMERMPRILEQQSDLTIDRVAQRFPIATVNPDFSNLPDLAADWQKQVADTLLAEDGVVTKSLPDVRASIESVERLTGSLQITLESANVLAGKVEKLPFAREDYLTALQETSTSLTQLNNLITGLNQMLDTSVAGEPKVAQLAQMLDQRADQLLDKAFSRALILIGVFFAGVVLSLVAARLILARRKTEKA